MHCACHPGSAMFARPVWLLLRMLMIVSVIHTVLAFRRRELGCLRGCHGEIIGSNHLIDTTAIAEKILLSEL
jgi:hypothetical protein